MRRAALLLAAGLFAGAAFPAQAQDAPFAGVWRCQGVIMGGVSVVYDIVLQNNGRYSGTYQASNGYRSYSTGPWRVLGNILRFDFQVWNTFPRPTTNPGGDGYYFQFQGPNVMVLFHYRCPQNPECRLACQRTQ